MNSTCSKPNVQMKSIFVFLIFSFVITFRLSSQISVYSTVSPTNIIQNTLLGAGVNVSNVKYNGSLVSALSPQANVSYFESGSSSFPFLDGLLLTSGAGSIAVGPNNLGGATDQTGTTDIIDADMSAITPNTITNGVVLEFDFVAVGDSISFKYIFASEEYPADFGTSFYDVFGFFLSGPGFSGPYTNGAVNIARLPGTTTPISILNINPTTNIAYYVNNEFGAAYGNSIQYDGTSVILNAGAHLICGQTYHIKLGISNVGDYALDSGVFLKGGSFTSNTLAATAGGTTTICSNGAATVSGASASAGTTISWTENGAGSITAGANTLTPTYTPAAGDAGTTVTLTMTVTKIICSVSQTATATYTIIVRPLPTAIAGGSATICSNGTATISGASSTNGTISWTENGAGSITSGGTTLTPTYTPTAGDAGNVVTLTMTVSSTTCTPAQTATAIYTINVNPVPTATAGGNTIICSNETATVSGASSTNGIISWSENGAGSITSGGATLTPTYTPAAGDVGNTVTLTMTVTSSTCTPAQTATAIYTVIVNPLPTATAGGTSTICSNGIVTVSGASSTNGTIVWTENGAGSITAGATTLTPTYTAAAGDAGTTVILTMTVTPICSSSTTVFATYTVIVNPLPTAIAGGSTTICSNGTATVSGASSTNGTISWTENGAGSITSGGTTLTPTYTAAIGDAGNVVTLTMTVTSTIACTPVITSTAIYTVNVTPLPTAIAGGTATICSNEPVTVSGASSSNGTISWTENGAGSITAGGTTLTPTYTPAAGDAGNTVTLTMTVSSTTCTPTQTATAIYTITVNPAPTAVAGGTSTICSNGTATVSGASSTNGTILWTENGAGSITSGATTLTPTYTAAAGDAGTTVTLTMTVTTSNCTPALTATAIYTVIVNPLPTAISAGTATICSNESVTVSGASSSNGTISWTENGAGSITAGGTTLTPTYTAAIGDAGNVVTLTMTVTSTIACTPAITATAIYTVNVNPLPTAVAGGTSTICSNETATVSGASSTNGTILWTENGAGLITSGATTLTPTYTAAAGDAGTTVTLTMTVTSTIACTPAITATAIYTVNVNPLPTAISGGTATICSNGSVTVSGASSSNGTILWTENGAGSITSGATTLTPTYTAAIGDAGTTVTLTMTVTSTIACTPAITATATYSVIVNPLPTAISAGTATICSNEAATVSGASSSNGTILWTENGAGSITSGATTLTPTYTAAIGDAGTTVTLTMTVTSTIACTPAITATAIYTVIVNPLPTATAGGSSTICSDESVTVSGATSSNGTILWTHNGTGSITAGATTLTPTYSAAAGDAGNVVILTMTVTSTIACTPAITSTAIYTVHVNPLPTAVAGGVSTICADETITVSGATSSNGTILWTHNGAGSITSGATTLTPTYTAATADGGNTVILTMTVTSTIACMPNITATAIYTVNVNPIPVFSITGYNPGVCTESTGHIEVTGLVPNTNYTIDYIDDAQPVGPLSVTSNGAGLIDFINLDAGSYEYFNIVYPLTGCSTLSTLNTSLLNPTAPVIDDIPNVVLCATQYTLPVITGLALTGSEAYFTITQAGGTMYHAGDIITSSQTLFIYDANGICTGQENFHIQLDQLPTAVAGGVSTICSNEILTVSGASATNGTILWTHNGVGAITSGATTTAPTYTAAVGDAGNTVILTMTVTSNNTCGTVVSAIYTINVTPLPTASAGGVSTICYNESLLIGGTTATNGTILWTHDGLGTLSNNTTLTPTYAPVIGDAGNTVILTMTVTSTIACTPSITAVANYAINVNPLPTASAGGLAGICSNGSVTVSGASATNGTILWTHDGDGSLTGQTTLTPTYTPSALDAGNVVTLTMIVTSTTPCQIVVTASALFVVTVNPIPTAFAGGTSTICSNESVTVSGASSTDGTILWTENGVGSITSGATTLTPTYTAATGDAGNTVTLTMTVTSTIACDPVISAVATYTVNVNPLPTSVSGGSASICTYEDVTVSGASSSNGTILWTHNGAGTISNGTTLTPTYSAVLADGGNTVVLTMSVTSTNCTPSIVVTSQFLVTVKALPVLTSITGDTIICKGFSTTLANPFAAGVWTSSNLSAATINASTGVALGVYQGLSTVNYEVTVNGCSNSTSVLLTVHGIPTAPQVTQPEVYCSNAVPPNMVVVPEANGSVVWSSDTGFNTIIGTSNFLTPKLQVGETIYYVANIVNECQSATSEFHIIIEDCPIEIPSAFTPDQDNFNDTWILTDLDFVYPKSEVSIFNRWGALLYKTGPGDYEQNSWDGTFNGEKLPVASYYYTIEYNNGTRPASSGTVTIVFNK